MGVCGGLVAVLVMQFGALSASALPGRLLAFAPQTGSTAAMTNQDVMRMAAAGLAEDVIITAMRQAPRRTFDLSASGLIELKQAKVADTIVRAMQALEDPVPVAPPTPAVSAARPPASPAALPAAPAPTPATVPEPGLAGELFIVSPTGTLTALERVRLRERKVGGARSQGMFKPSVQDYAYYLEGGTSPVTVKTDDPQVFVIRMMGSTNRWGKEPTAEEAQRHFLLTKLQSEEGRRYITKVDVQLDARSYGRPTPGVDSKRFERVAVSFQLTPQSVLGPGEYVILMAGTSNSEFIGNLNSGADRWAFTIADR